MVKFVSTKFALDNILCSNDFKYLKSQILDSDEIELHNDKYNILFANGKNLKYNIYTNIEDETQFRWIGVFHNTNLLGLQLISITDNIELIVIEKNNNIDVCSIFEPVLDFVKTFNKDIVTFPFNDKLKTYYKSFGFADDKNNYIILKND